MIQVYQDIMYMNQESNKNVLFRGLVCQMRPDVGEFGVYRLNVNSTTCNLDTLKDPVDIYLRKLITVKKQI